MHLHITLVLAFATALAGALPGQRSPAAALDILTAGNRRFVEEQSVVPPLSEGLRRSLARGQSPLAIVVSCSDSQLPPEHVFNCGLGDLFVVRTAGTGVDAEVIASVEYAAEHLGVQLCVVLTHESCSAVRACAEQATPDAKGLLPEASSQAMQALLERIEPAVRKARSLDLGGRELSDQAEEEQAQLGVSETMRRSPVLRFLHRQGRFRMVAARCRMLTGAVEWLPERPLPQVEPTTDQKPAPIAVPDNVPPHTALRLLQAGHRRFLSAQKPTGDVSARRREALTHSQQPMAIVVACSDSRVSPEILFDTGLGDLFVVRVAGNVLNDVVLASIEHAVTRTGASLCVVLGHSACGAVTAACKGADDEHQSLSMRSLLARLEPSVERARALHTSGQQLIDLAIRLNVQRFVTEARTRSTDLRRLEQAGRFAMMPAVYDLASGDLKWLEESKDLHAAPAAPIGETTHAPKSGSAHREVKAKEPVPGPAHGEHAAPSGTTTHATRKPAPRKDNKGFLANFSPLVVAILVGILTLASVGLLIIRRRAS